MGPAAMTVLTWCCDTGQFYRCLVLPFDLLYSGHYHTVRFLHYLRMILRTALFRLTSTTPLQRHGRS